LPLVCRGNAAVVMAGVTLGGLFGDVKYEKTAKLRRCCSVGQVACCLGVINSCVPFTDGKQRVGVLRLKGSQPLAFFLNSNYSTLEVLYV